MKLLEMGLAALCRADLRNAEVLLMKVLHKRSKASPKTAIEACRALVDVFGEKRQFERANEMIERALTLIHEPGDTSLEQEFEELRQEFGTPGQIE